MGDEMSRQILPATQDWKAGLFDPGEGGDCLRSCFIGCDQFGRTNHRLQHLERHEDPTDLSKYDGCNENCWNYALLCIGTLGSYSWLSDPALQIANQST